MADINLLPWREQQREDRKRQFILALVLTAGIGLLISFLIHMGINNKLNYQLSKNQYLQAEVDTLDQQIKEIRDLRGEKQRLLARMKIIQDLQSGRPFVVHLFDEMARLLPKGIYLESVKREGDNITITGKAESNTEISQFMRNINLSNWLTKPSLSEIKTLNNDQQYHSDFKLQLKQKKSIAERALVEMKK